MIAQRILPRRRWTVLATVAFAVGLVAPVAADRPPARSFTHDASLEGVDRLRLDVPVGEVLVEVAAGASARAEVEISCRSRWVSAAGCERRARRIELREKRRGSRLSLELEGYRWWMGGAVKVEVRVRVPSSVALEVDLGIGELEISGPTGGASVDLGIGDLSILGATGDVRVDMGIGEATVEVDGRGVRTVRVDLGIGESTILRPDGRLVKAGVFGSENEWSGGIGEGGVDVELGIGEVEVLVR